MAKQIEVRGFVDEEGRLQLYDRIGFKERLPVLKGSEIILSVRTFSDTRTERQNRYYWGVIIPFICSLLKESGWDYDFSETHDYLRSEFGYSEIINDKTGEIKRKIISSSRLTKDQFSVYIERLNKFVSENFDVILPKPDEKNANIIEF